MSGRDRMEETMNCNPCACCGAPYASKVIDETHLCLWCAEQYQEILDGRSNRIEELNRQHQDELAEIERDHQDYLQDLWSAGAKMAADRKKQEHRKKDKTP